MSCGKLNLIKKTTMISSLWAWPSVFDGKGLRSFHGKDTMNNREEGGGSFIPHGVQVDSQTGQGVDGRDIHVAYPHSFVCGNCMYCLLQSADMLHLALWGVTPCASTLTVGTTVLTSHPYACWTVYQCPRCGKLHSSLCTKDVYVALLRAGTLADVDRKM